MNDLKTGIMLFLPNVSALDFFQIDLKLFTAVSISLIYNTVQIFWSISLCLVLTVAPDSIDLLHHLLSVSGFRKKMKITNKMLNIKEHSFEILLLFRIRFVGQDGWTPKNCINRLTFQMVCTWSCYINSNLELVRVKNGKSLWCTPIYYVG